MDQGTVIKFSVAITAILIITATFLLNTSPSQSVENVTTVQKTAKFLESMPFHFNMSTKTITVNPNPSNSAELNPTHENLSEDAVPEPTPVDDGFFHEHDLFITKINEEIRQLETHPDAEKIDELLRKVSPLFKKIKNMNESDRIQVEQWRDSLDQILEPYTHLDARAR